MISKFLPSSVRMSQMGCKACVKENIVSFVARVSGMLLTNVGKNFKLVANKICDSEVT